MAQPEGTYGARHRAAPAVLRWSHGARFRFARRMVAPFAGRRILDYGCGDGIFLDAVRDIFPRGVGAEVDPGLVAEAEQRLGGNGLSFVHTDALANQPDGSFGVVVCMEVLEHCTDQAAESLLAAIHRLTQEDGRLLVSVPVETGPALLAKHAVRALAGLRGVEGYRERERYSPGELARMVFAGAGSAIPRPIYDGRFADGSPSRYHGHKGFNWRAMRLRISRRFAVEQTRFSPFPWLPAGLNSQAWFLCRPR